MLPPVANIERAIADFATKENLAAAYLHGSAATGRMDAESDVDVALLPQHSLTADERWDLRLRCIGFLMEKFPSEERKFDVVILQDVPVLLRYNIIRKGACIFENTRVARMDFEVATERAYDDEEPYLRREADMTLRWILSHA